MVAIYLFQATFQPSSEKGGHPCEWLLTAFAKVKTDFFIMAAADRWSWNLHNTDIRDTLYQVTGWLCLPAYTKSWMFHHWVDWPFYDTCLGNICWFSNDSHEIKRWKPLLSQFDHVLHPGCWPISELSMNAFQTKLLVLHNYLFPFIFLCSIRLPEKYKPSTYPFNVWAERSISIWSFLALEKWSCPKCFTIALCFVVVGSVMIWAGGTT